MADLHALKETRQLLKRTVDLRDALDVSAESIQALIDAMERGSSTEELVAGMAGPKGREEMTGAFERYDAQRYRWRVALMRVWLREGRTITDFARHNGFSRQYAQKIAKEAVR